MAQKINLIFKRLYIVTDALLASIVAEKCNVHCEGERGGGVGFNIFEAFPYPGITGQNWSPSREIPGSRDLLFSFNKGK